jgi:hypothetical protein
MSIRERNTATGQVIGVATESALIDGLGSKLDLAGGKILQIVRTTDTTQRETTSTTFVDANLSVTITPQKSDSAVLLVATHQALATGTGSTQTTEVVITDNSNNVITGSLADLTIISTPVGGGPLLRMINYQTLIGYSTPGVMSATTYKLRFRIVAGGLAVLLNDKTTGQLFAIEVSA